MKTLTFRSKAARGALVLASGLMFWMLSGLSHAAPITFTIDAVDVEFSNERGACIGGGCTPTVNTALPIEFMLNDIGESTSFNLFDVDIGGSALGLGGADVSTTVSFSSPSNALSGAATGRGSFFSAFFFQNGSLTFTAQPANIVFDNGTEITLALSGGTNTCSGFGGCTVNVGVTASSTLVSQADVQAVPEPASLALFGAGLLGFGAMRRRQLNAR